jgi:hypothetical protein
MPVCKIGHELRTERGFKMFEPGVDYPESEIGDRVKYFEIETIRRTQKNNRQRDVEKPEVKRTEEKITEEVTDNAG